MSDVTKKYKKRSISLTALSWFICFGTAIMLITVAMTKFMGNEQQTIIALSGRFGDKAQEMLDKLKTVITTSLVSMIPMFILSIIVKDKIRPLIWMINIILANILLGSTFMYIVFGSWFLDEYIIRVLAKSSRAKFVINKEIDKRK